MALFLPESRTLWLEIPKTGTTFLRAALQVLEIDHREAVPIGTACPRHSPAECYREEWDHLVAHVRHPVTWLESYYRASYQAQHNGVFEAGRWYCFRPLGLTTELGFNDWIRRLLRTEPAYVTRLYECFLGSFDYCRADYVLRSERLRSGILDTLWGLGYEPDLLRLDALAELNVAPTSPVRWNPHLKSCIEQTERPAIRRFYDAED